MVTRPDRRRGDTCLQCGASRMLVKAEGLTCGIVEGYESPELTYEFAHHRWRSWTDAELAAFRIRPLAYDKHRRTSWRSFEWVACEDTLAGHRPATEDDLEWSGCSVGQCVACGRMPLAKDHPTMLAIQEGITAMEES